MLAQLPLPVQILFLGALGIAIGAFINWAIYGWAMFLRRQISPWMKPAEGESPRQSMDYCPIIGWPGRGRDSKIYGKGFWIRPMLIEIAWMLGVPWFYLWLAGGGLVGSALQAGSLQAETWFWFYSVFLALMTIGTFIDFDEKTIPDEVTVPGTLIALTVAAFAPWSRLPELIKGGTAMRSVTHTFPDAAAPMPPDWGELAVGLSIFVIWIWALMPKLPVWYVGWGTSTRFMYAHAFQPKRKTACELRTKPRSLPGVTLFLCAILVIGSAAILAAWARLPAENWSSLYGSLIGLAFGGAMIWSIRIIGTYALQKEAMGFGDVTLMAMIGATLGWQATLIAFVCAMIVVVLGLVVQIIATGNQALAFGPYLCAGATLAVYYWNSLWPSAARGVFGLGNFVWWILGASMVLMAAMLLGLQWIKSLFGFDGEEVAE